MVLSKLLGHTMFLLGTLSVLTFIPQAVSSYVPSNIRDPCQTIKCRAGFYCELLPTPCVPPGPCIPVPVCVKEPPSNPGQCPKLTGLLKCSNDCARDNDCGPVLKCCSHNCGRKCVKPQPTVPPRPQYPCNHVKCSLGRECRLRHEKCSSRNCPVNPQCVPSSLPPTKPRCKIGRPVLDHNNAEWDCGNNTNSRHCPGDTVCNIKYGVCCFNDQTEPGPVNRCNGVKCPRGEECRVDTIFCVTIPCPEPQPVCRATNKPGSCPVNLPILSKPCLSKCTNDADCGGTQKCCGGCPRQCTVAAPPLPKEKPGSCPKPPPGLIGICIVRCTFDSDCEGDKKCCGGCPRECKTPVILPPKVKPGSCPKVAPGLIGPCIARCTFDSDCLGDLKCCGNCPRQCTAAVTAPRVKPGFCPISQDGRSNKCIKQCTDDFSCPRDSKCCVSGCRRTCKRLLLEAPYAESDPCQKKVCQDNQVCKLQKVTCVRRPCYPQPICVAKRHQDSSSVCLSGYPALEVTNRPLSCLNSASCPAGTTCLKRSCCWNKEVEPVTPPPARCPVIKRSRRQHFLCTRYPRCQTDRTCPSGRKCCRVGRCGKRCLQVKT